MVNNSPFDLIQFLSALLTPAIALITTYIAIQQYRLNKFNTRKELYDRRLGVYQATMSFLAIILGSANAPRDASATFLKETSLSHFLFKKDIPEYLETIYKKANDLYSTHTKMQADRERLKGNEWEKLVDRNSDLFEWFADKFEVTKEKFMPYLSLKD